MDEAPRYLPREELVFFRARCIRGLAILVLLLLVQTAVYRMLQGGGLLQLSIAFLLEGVFLGCLFAEFTSLAAWSALFPGRTLARLVTSALVATAVALALAISLDTLPLFGMLVRPPHWIVDRAQLLLNALTAAVVGPYLLLLVQAPFWLLRALRGIRVERRAAEVGATRYRLGSLFELVLLCAAPVALVRIALFGDMRGEISALALFFGLGAVTFLWSTVWCLRENGRLVLAVSLLITIEMAVLAGVLIAGRIDTHLPFTTAYWVVCAVGGMQAAALCKGVQTARALRREGYHFVTRRSAAATPIPVGAASAGGEADVVASHDATSSPS